MSKFIIGSATARGRRRLRYGAAWALQNQGRYDDAVNLYNQVTAATATELGRGAVEHRPMPAGAEAVSGGGDGVAGGAVYLRLSEPERAGLARSVAGLRGE